MNSLWGRWPCSVSVQTMSLRLRTVPTSAPVCDSSNTAAWLVLRLVDCAFCPNETIHNEIAASYVGKLQRRTMRNKGHNQPNRHQPTHQAMSFFAPVGGSSASKAHASPATKGPWAVCSAYARCGALGWWQRRVGSGGVPRAGIFRLFIHAAASGSRGPPSSTVLPLQLLRLPRSPDCVHYCGLMNAALCASLLVVVGWRGETHAWLERFRHER